MEKLNRSLSVGIIPDELNYTVRENNNIDLLKLRYNTFYKSHEYFDKRFHPCLKSLPGYDKIIDQIVEQNKDNSLTKEIKERQNIIINDNIIDGN
jgi:hypothetical protein